jgi:flagellar hook protein FlgE
MFSAVSGLSAHQTKMNVIGNNIANVNTYGFKASRVTFSDVFYQTMNGASAPNGNGGGSNPTQLGYGARVNSVDVINTRAGSATTDRALDVYINGEGYLPVKTSDGTIQYTRIGVLSFDVVGSLVDSNGNKVLGFDLVGADKNPSLSENGNTTVQNLKEISVSPSILDKLTGIAIGQNGEITGILEGDPTVLPSANTGWINGVPEIKETSVYNGSLTMSATMDFSPVGYTGDGVKISSNADISGNLSLSLNTAGTEYTLTYNGTETITIDASEMVDDTLTFKLPNHLGEMKASVTIPVGTDGYTIPNDDSVVNLGSANPTVFNLTATTYDKSGAIVTLTDTWDSSTTDEQLVMGDLTINLTSADFKDALEAGFQSVSIGNIGPGAGVPTKLAHIASVKFTNPDGLSQEGQGYFVGTINSGEPVATVPGNSGTGTFRAGALEMSNVDLSREFTEMIITQRGFQANTRMITVSDEMLSELISMKR